MRDQLIDLTKQLSPLFRKAKVISEGGLTRLAAIDEDKILYLKASFKKPIKELQGEFGISNLAVLGQLLSLASYKSDDAKLLVHYSEELGHITEFEFQDGKHSRSHTKFKTTNPRLVGEANIADITWNVTSKPSKSAIAEFTQLSGILSEVATFSISVEDGVLYGRIGAASASTHSSCVVLATDVTGSFNATLPTWNTRYFLSILKNAPANSVPEVRFSERGVLGITVETDHASYNYFLRAKPQ